MRQNSWFIVLLLVFSLGMTISCNSSKDQETEKLRKELDTVKKEREDEKIAKEKEDLQESQASHAAEKKPTEVEKEKVEPGRSEKSNLPTVDSEVASETMTISSPDGYLYLRSGPSMNSTIIATGYND